MDDVYALSFYEAIESPDNPGMNIPADIEEESIEVIQAGFLREPASFTTREPHSVIPLLKLSGHFKCLNFQSSPGMGKTSLENMESPLEWHSKEPAQA